jgi:Secretion system C-terminal sorting domain/Cleaved Adhesin Domain
MMKKLLLSIGLLTSVMSANAQIVLFQDSFDTYTDFAIASVGAWTLNDVDLRPTYGFGGGTTFLNSGVAMSYIVFNSTAVSPALVPGTSSDWSARSGQKAMACIAAVPNTTVTKNNDWLISPQITLGTVGNTLSFWAKSCDSAYFEERFTVNISTTGTTPASFTKISAGTFIQTAFGPYVQYTYNLDAYQGQTVRVGINCVSADQFGFMLDDFKVTATTVSSSLKSLALEGVKMYPNPAKNILNIDYAGLGVSNVSITDLNGRILKDVKGNVSTIAIADLSQGIYIVTINTEKGSKVEKLIIE